MDVFDIFVLDFYCLFFVRPSIFFHPYWTVDAIFVVFIRGTLFLYLERVKIVREV